jgi:hypothetical protein
MTMKKDSPSGEKTHVTQLCGGLGIQVRGWSAFPKMSFPDSVKGWQDNWFYCKDVPSEGSSIGLPPYSGARVTVPPSLEVSKEEKVDVGILTVAMVGAVNAGVNGMDLLESF